MKLGAACCASATIAILALVAACRPAPDADANAAADAAPTGSNVPAPVDSGVDINASLALDQLNGLENHTPPPEAGALPPADAPLRFVGRWAVDAGLCATAPWRFTAQSLSTPAGAYCRFRRIEEMPGGVDISALCKAEGPERRDTIRLRFAESAGAMLFESTTIADAGLVYCGP